MLTYNTIEEALKIIGEAAATNAACKEAIEGEVAVLYAAYLKDKSVDITMHWKATCACWNLMSDLGYKNEIEIQREADAWWENHEKALALAKPKPVRRWGGFFCFG